MDSYPAKISSHSRLYHGRADAQRPKHRRDHAGLRNSGELPARYPARSPKHDLTASHNYSMHEVPAYPSPSECDSASSSGDPTPYDSVHESHAQSPYEQSEVSLYSLSKYTPSKRRFRIQHEGNSLVVLPPNSFSHRLAPTPDAGWRSHYHGGNISHKKAKDFIDRGAPHFEGKLRETPGGHRFFSFAGHEWDEETDTAPFQSDSFGDMSSAPEGKQTDALERPAMAHAFGSYPGTVTLSCYVAGFSKESPRHEMAIRGKVRKLTMLYVLDRLRILQVNGIEEDPIDLHNHLYEFLLHGHRWYEPHRQSLDTQIDDLVAALIRPTWIDFSQAENQTIARFLVDAATSNSFFHQLLLSIELYLRIKARDHKGMASDPLERLPEPVRWDLMLAQRWLENVEMKAPQKLKESSRDKSSIEFTFPNKKNQLEALKDFAWTLKWPNMHEVKYTLLEEENPDELLEDRSPNCMSWFTGLLMPGKSMPWILMNALIDCDVDTPKEFHNLDQSVPNTGFQYRGHTYWSWECIVGKVLGAASGVSQIAGWIGPCTASADLERAEVAIINQKPHKGIRLGPEDVRMMGENSDPIGPYADEYPVSDYSTVALGGLPVDSVRIERLNFSPTGNGPRGTYGTALCEQNLNRPGVMFDASITFAITIEQRARSWKVSLRHDTPFIAAYPCQDGPHVLYCEYRYRLVRVDELVEIQDWGLESGKDSDDQASDLNEVLLVEALGLPDNEVFARAWCSYYGLVSITADINQTCAACAIREAYAALVSVVILTDRQTVDVDVEEVDRMMENL